MIDATRSSSRTFTSELRGTWRDVAELLNLRRRLAEQELRGDMAAVRRFAVVAIVSACSALMGLSLLTTALVLQLEHGLGLESHWLTVGIGAGVLLLGVGVCAAAGLRFRRQFSGLKQTIHELKEDLAWIRERFDDDAEAEAG